MIRALLQAESVVPDLLRDLQGWRGILVDYEEPHVERLSRPLDLQDGPVTAFLHWIHPCASKPFFHPHPWPSAVKIYKGIYKMEVGHGLPLSPLVGFGMSRSEASALAAERPETPPISSTIWLPPGSMYEMVHKDGWHSVAPEGGPVLSLMVIGPAWDVPYRPGKGTTKALTRPRMGELQQTFLDLFSTRG